MQEEEETERGGEGAFSRGIINSLSAILSALVCNSIVKSFLFHNDT